MALVDLNITEQYAAFQILRQSQLNAAMTSIETYVTNNIKLNFQQLGLDVFGNTYVFNNNGVQTITPPLVDQAGNLSQNETVTGSWTFQNTTAFNGTVNFNGPVNGNAQPRTKAVLIVADQAIPNAIFTAINYNGEIYDVGAMHDVGLNNSRITIPTSGSGIYVLNAQVRFQANGAGRREVRITKNAVEIARKTDVAAAAGFPSYLQIVVQDAGVVGDFYEVEVYQDSAGALNAEFTANSTFFEAVKVW